MGSGAFGRIPAGSGTLEVTFFRLRCDILREIGKRVLHSTGERSERNGRICHATVAKCVCRLAQQRRCIALAHMVVEGYRYALRRTTTRC